MPLEERVSPRWRLAWWVCWVLTALNGVVVGAGSVWFQLFGESPDRGDYLVSAGGYLTAAAVLGLAVVPARGRGIPAWALIAVTVVALCLAVAGLRSLSEAAELPAHRRPSAGVADGIGGVIFLPWCWVLLWMAGRAAWDGMRAHRSAA